MAAVLEISVNCKSKNDALQWWISFVDKIALSKIYFVSDWTDKKHCSIEDPLLILKELEKGSIIFSEGKGTFFQRVGCILSNEYKRYILTFWLGIEDYPELDSHCINAQNHSLYQKIYSNIVVAYKKYKLDFDFIAIGSEIYMIEEEDLRQTVLSAKNISSLLINQQSVPINEIDNFERVEFMIDDIVLFEKRQKRQ